MTLLLGVFVASLLGSVHCGAMCSVFACMANSGARRGVWYHAGRLMAYVSLGAVAGAVGAGINAAGLVADVQRTATLVASAGLVVWGLLHLRAAMTARTLASATQWGGVLGRQLARTAQWDPRARAAAIGVTTGLLPCGWLWAFIATAMGTGAPLRAGAVMVVFWAGTVPVLAAAAAGVRRFGPLATVRWPLASASLVLMLGLAQLASHLLMSPMRLSDPLRQSHGAIH